MPRIVESLPNFIAALNDNQSITCSKTGTWNVPGKFCCFVRNIFFKKKGEDAILRAFQHVLSEVESSKLYFNASAEVMQKQTEFYQNIIQAGRAVIQYASESFLQQLLFGPSYQNLRSIIPDPIMKKISTRVKEVKELCNSLDLSIIQLQYRIQAENGGFETLTPEKVDTELVQKLKEKVEEWKKKDEKYEYTQEQDFTAKIQKICQYPEIVSFLLKPENETQCAKYLQRSLRDNFDIEVLNQYPHESDVLNKNFMICRIGAIANKLIGVELTPAEDSSSLKKLNLLIEGKKINLLDKEQKIHFSNGLNWRLPRIYRDFHDKNDSPGDLEIMWDGIVPFNGHKLGPRILPERKFWEKFKIIRKIIRLFSKKQKKYASIDTLQSEWHKNMPVLDIRPKAYIERRFGITIQDGKKNVFVLEATRASEKLDVDKAHGYLTYYELIEDNNYRVYSLGAFPIKFPQNKVELAAFVGNTVEGTVAFDPNYYYSQSQKASWANFLLDDSVGEAILVELGKRRAQGITFQFGWENCAYFMSTVFSKVFKEKGVKIDFPNFFTKKFIEMKPKNPALRVIQWPFKKKMPKIFQQMTKNLFAIAFGAYRWQTVRDENGHKNRVTLWDSPFFTEMDTNVPSVMHHHITEELEKRENAQEFDPQFITNCALNYGHQANPVIVTQTS